LTFPLKHRDRPSLLQSGGWSASCSEPLYLSAEFNREFQSDSLCGVQCRLSSPQWRKSDPL